MMQVLVLVLALCLPLLAHAETRPDLDQLLAALAEAPDTAAATGLEQRIARLWQQQAGPTAAMLLGRSAQELAAKDVDDALADIDAALTLAPGSLDALHHRALARYEQGDVAGATHDLEEILRREPRHFPSWHSLAEIAEIQGHTRAALAAWEKLMALDPKTRGGAEHLKDLRHRVEGEES
jgi:Tfp pilus assembly protein PilF